jgi:hypothetical protein
MKQEILKILENEGLLSSDRVFAINQKIGSGEDFEEVIQSFQIPSEKVADAKSKVFDLPRWVGADPDDVTVKKLSGESSKHYPKETKKKSTLFAN